MRGLLKVRWAGESSPLPSPYLIDDVLMLRGSAEVNIEAERFSSWLHLASPDAMIISSVLLSYNPAASAIVDGVAFTPPSRIAVDMSNSCWIGSEKLLSDSLETLGKYIPSLFISADRDEILSFIRG